PEKSSGGRITCAPRRAASSTSAQTAAIFCRSSSSPRASCSAATVSSAMAAPLCAGGPGVNRRRALRELAKQQRHAVAFADFGAARAFLAAFRGTAIGRRKRPDAAFPIGRIRWIGVHLALFHQFETIGFEQADHVFLA